MGMVRGWRSPIPGTPGGTKRGLPAGVPGSHVRFSAPSIAAMPPMAGYPQGVAQALFRPEKRAQRSPFFSLETDGWGGGLRREGVRVKKCAPSWRSWKAIAGMPFTLGGVQEVGKQVCAHLFGPCLCDTAMASLICVSGRRSLEGGE